MKPLVLLLIMLPSAVFAAAPDGKNIVLHGNSNGALPCAACHGVDGKGNASIGAPELAGMPAATIEDYLSQFANGEGGNSTMQYIAQALSPAESQAVAQYLSSLPK